MMIQANLRKGVFSVFDPIERLAMSLQLQAFPEKLRCLKKMNSLFTNLLEFLN